jgi:hypothetical protein
MITIIDNFLMKHELEHFNILIENSDYELSRVGFNEISTRRTSTETDVSDNEIIKNLCKRILPENLKYELEAKIIKYKIGQYMGLHHDEVDWDDNEENLCEMYSNEDQYRKYSIIIFLTEDLDGGILSFPLLNMEIKPKIGKLVIFENISSDLQVNKLVIHESTIITRGIKIVLVIFVSVSK